MLKQTLLFLFPIVFTLSCGISSQADTEKATYENHTDKSFDTYWYNGKAELNSYALEQSRYGEMRKGEAVLVFVTEDFLTKKQVKKEKESSAAYTSALKLNFIRKFTTGIYDYSMMTSVFSPINQEENNLPIKISSSSQEWCGQSFTQLNQTGKHYQLRSFSYFEKEGDKNRLLDLTASEDGLWTQIRIAPNKIPLGKLKLIPGAQYQRFTHDSIKAYDTNISKSTQKDSSGNTIIALKITYPKVERTLRIFYQKDFPHQITGWEETRKHNGKQVITKAKLKANIRSPYWEKNALKDTVLRKKLKLNY